MSDDLTFLDTNILVYAYDTDAGHKHQTARSIVADLWNAGSGALSTQVLQEFYVTSTRKLPRPLPKGTAREVVANYRAWPLHRPDVDDLVTASELEERHTLSFWDALILVAADRLGARTVLSEDLQDGRRVGGVVIRNPFAAAG